jgi:hypothetical protein
MFCLSTNPETCQNHEIFHMKYFQLFIWPKDASKRMVRIQVWLDEVALLRLRIEVFQMYKHMYVHRFDFNYLSDIPNYPILKLTDRGRQTLDMIRWFSDKLGTRRSR